MPRYHRTLITYEVLSDEPVPSDMDPAEVWRECMEGGWSGTELDRTQTELGRSEMATALESQGSDPTFLIPDWDGGDAPLSPEPATLPAAAELPTAHASMSQVLSLITHVLGEPRRVVATGREIRVDERVSVQHTQRGWEVYLVVEDGLPFSPETEFHSRPQNLADLAVAVVLLAYEHDVRSRAQEHVLRHLPGHESAYQGTMIQP